MMTASMADSEQTLLDRYLAGELSKARQRALAQTLLDDPELFDLLATVAAIKALVVHDGVGSASTAADEAAHHERGEARRFRRRQFLLECARLPLTWKKISNDR
jgi:hypothetical protein